ncbi:MAG: toll/interleukin-1 receptor domain-containing protein [Cyanobacteria bacterium P01_E01_bin.6]
MTESAFINYRRDDSGPKAKLIADALSRTLSPEAVFLDTESIDFGDAWPDRLRSALAASRYVFVVIGPDWLTAGANDWGQRRIDNDNDWVRQEIQNALGDGTKTIIPLLIRGAKMPPPEALPSCIAAVTSKQNIEIRRDYWDHDIKLLTAKLGAQMPDLANLAPANPLVKGFWDNLSPSLQDAIVLAANAARREGKDIISTRTLFAALRRLHPAPLPEFFDQIPSEALPEPLPQDLTADINAHDLAKFSKFFCFKKKKET